MSDVLNQILDGLSGAGKEGIGKAVGELGELSASADKPIEKALLGMLAGALEEHGPAGLDLAQKQFESMLDKGKLDVSKLRGLPMSQRGALIAAAEAEEGDLKKASDKFFTSAGQTLGKVLSGLLKAVI